MLENQICPDFSQASTSNLTFTLSTAKKPLVLYFYPKDSTPGCTNEAIEFGDAYQKFMELGVNIVGISRDSLSSHEKFKAKFNLPFELLSDSDESICNIFEVIKDKNMYGKTVRGIERSTFVINQDMRIIHAWRKVKVDGHAAEVLHFVQSMLGQAENN